MVSYSSAFSICLQIWFLQSLAWEHKWKLLKQIRGKQWKLLLYYYCSVSFSSNSVDNLSELNIPFAIWHYDTTCSTGLAYWLTGQHFIWSYPVRTVYMESRESCLCWLQKFKSGKIVLFLLLLVLFNLLVFVCLNTLDSRLVKSVVPNIWIWFSSYAHLICNSAFFFPLPQFR